ncbi:hypothetical protein CD30_11020 [Ureibacillus massiliensis 4400831 = CIP 108448 = CCUG 49529]|uniref:Uncharacterized protein n=1 Tax=Ureibacillus massiliensis 4400831 = CIP 108448 = CCUG 49529 TaxID=1211035 RepID=A0A0A3JU95_9BACL|nr:hypothetical protein [Ureibacillus massiliensis]KGR90592.1 hypothetical protein CD30_11020 [Ureibacillus massiliensis 4400831 = CIP 108448 = CCUG 49529]
MGKRIFPILLILTLLLGACDLKENQIYEDASVDSAYDVTDFEKFPLVSVVDGDTIAIIYKGKRESVRFFVGR